MGGCKESLKRIGGAEKELKGRKGLRIKLLHVIGRKAKKRESRTNNEKCKGRGGKRRVTSETFQKEKTSGDHTHKRNTKGRSHEARETHRLRARARFPKRKEKTGLRGNSSPRRRKGKGPPERGNGASWCRPNGARHPTTGL